MVMMSVGDMRQHFLSVRNNANLRSDLNTLVQELTTGRASDLTRHLGSGQTRLASTDRQLELIDQYSKSNRETSQSLSLMQLSLSAIESHRGVASSALLKINEASTSLQVRDAAHTARSSLDATVQSLNARFADRAMFGGNDFGPNPMASSEVIMDELKVIITGLTSASDVQATVGAWFDSPTGGFQTVAYQGDTTGFIQRPSDIGQTVEIGIRADDVAFRDMMKALALGALAGDDTLALNEEVRQQLLQDAGVDLLTVSASIASLQGRLGSMEAQVEDASVRLSAQETSIGISRNELVLKDPFETATKLEQVQLQLETHYTLTARLSRLSLTEYLR